MQKKAIQPVLKAQYTLKEAQKYYDAIVKELFEANLTLTTGQDFEDLKWIYTTYCGYTKHNLEKLSECGIIGVKGIRTIREKRGQYVPTDCGVIIFSDGSEEKFYTDKAIKTIAIQQNSR